VYVVVCITQKVHVCVYTTQGSAAIQFSSQVIQHYQKAISLIHKFLLLVVTWPIYTHETRCFERLCCCVGCVCAFSVAYLFIFYILCLCVLQCCCCCCCCCIVLLLLPFVCVLFSLF